MVTSVALNTTQTTQYSPLSANTDRELTNISVEEQEQEEQEEVVVVVEQEVVVEEEDSDRGEAAGFLVMGLDGRVAV